MTKILSNALSEISILKVNLKYYSEDPDNMELYDDMQDRIETIRANIETALVQSAIGMEEVGV